MTANTPDEHYKPITRTPKMLRDLAEGHLWCAERYSEMNVPPHWVTRRIERANKLLERADELEGETRRDR